MLESGTLHFFWSLSLTRPICKFHTVVFSSIINPYFMLWVIFPIPDPVTSFKKIHVPIRLAHRHSFNEQINHSDGYNGVITGFKYDNLHPNGAAKPWLRAKKVDKIGASFILFSIWDKAGHRKPWVTQRGRFRKGIIIQSEQLFLGEVTFVGSLKAHAGMFNFDVGKNFHTFLAKQFLL